jgi:DNA-binding PadR family transcriptional regulator
VNTCYYEAKMESSNTSQMIIHNIRRGLLMEAKKRSQEGKSSRKVFTLTRSGEEYLQKALTSSTDDK